MSDIPLREYIDRALADSDKRLEEKLAALEKLRDMDREYALSQFDKIDIALNEFRVFSADVAARIKQIGAGLLFLVSIIGLIQWWRGSP